MKYANLRHSALAATFTLAFALAPRVASAQEEPEPSTESSAEEDSTPPITRTPASKSSDRPRGLTWTALTGYIPESGGIIHGEMGFSGLPRASYQHAIGSGLSLGATLAFDFMGSRVGPFQPSFMIGATARYGLMLPMDTDLGLRATVGARIPGPAKEISTFGINTTSGRDAAIVIDIDANAGWIVAHRFLVGAGITLPLEIAFGGTAGSTFNVPILIGAIAEYHVTAPLGLTLDVKAGPHMSTADGIAFGMRAMLGIAYRI